MSVTIPRGSPAGKVIEADLMAALKVRFPFGEQKQWALLPQVRSSSGFDVRTADAVAIGLWASTGHHLIGFELKVSRGDWKREALHPEKADAIFGFCDRWYVVAPKGIVPLDFGLGLALPEQWGLLEFDGRVLTETKKAPKLTPKPLTKGFIAQLFKAAYLQLPGATELAAAEARGRADSDARWAEDVERERARADDARKDRDARAREVMEAFGLSEWDIKEAKRRGLLVKEALEAERIRSKVAGARQMAIEVLASTQDFAQPDEVDRLLADRFREQSGPLWEAIRMAAGVKPPDPPRPPSFAEMMGSVDGLQTEAL